MYIGLVLVQAAAMVEEAKAREEWLNSLPKDEADRIRAEDVERRREKLLHRRAIEVAEAGRPRNFWGK